jgi:hypothetical protein
LRCPVRLTTGRFVDFSANFNLSNNRRRSRPHSSVMLSLMDQSSRRILSAIVIYSHQFFRSADFRTCVTVPRTDRANNRFRLCVADVPAVPREEVVHAMDCRQSNMGSIVLSGGRQSALLDEGACQLVRLLMVVSFSSLDRTFGFTGAGLYPPPRGSRCFAARGQTATGVNV